MPVDLHPPQVADLLAVAGVRIGVTQAGVRKAGRKDVTPASSWSRCRMTA